MIETVGETASLLEVAIATGRTHQIRVHAAHSGTPLRATIVTATRSSSVARAPGLRRMFLHSHSLSFIWPESGEEFSVSVPLPAGAQGRAERYGGRPRGSSPADLSAAASQINGKPISAVGSRDSMCSNSATPSASALKLPTQSNGCSMSR